MSAEPQIEQATQEQPKSKRLSSLIWILVLWGFVRLISEMDGISWERAFWTIAELIGLLPSTLFLLATFFLPIHQHSQLRICAAIAFLLALLEFSILGYQSSDGIPLGSNFFLQEQVAIAILIIALLLVTRRSETK